jgi:hypothetical protein
VSRGRYPQRQLGEAVEDQAVAATDALAPGERFDALVSRPIDGRSLPAAWTLGTAVIPAGAYVEVKAAQRRVASGRRGRWLFRHKQHERLLDCGGVYGLAIYDAGRPNHDLLAVALVPASVVDELLGAWTAIDADRVEEAVAKLCWSRVVDPGGVGT